MDSSKRRTLAFIAIAVLVVLNLVLILALVLRPTTPDPSESPPPVTLAPSPTGTEPTEISTPTEDEPDEPHSDDDADSEDPLATPGPTSLPPAERFLANFDDSIAWRGTVGSCDAPGELERTVDGGESWEPVEIDLAPLSRLRPLGPEGAFAIGGDNCEPTYINTTDGGISWVQNNDLLDGSWYLHPADPDYVGSPSGLVEAPCEIARLVGLDTVGGGVLCADGTLMITDDAAITWDVASPDAAVLAMGPADEGYVTINQADACDEGFAVASLDRMGATDAETCVNIPDPDDLAISAAGSGVWIWDGEEAVFTPEVGLS
ncbi:hypothetical protein [Pseudactinotalea sp. Z1748]|uniref:hypothetical protein n=1 Tax=Pseudactinotalea sp. Z1748 TaxID=3413027 RepID=UPI003C7B92CE